MHDWKSGEGGYFTVFSLGVPLVNNIPVTNDVSFQPAKLGS